MINHSTSNTFEWLSATGNGVKILILDSGVDLSHAAFKGRTIKCRRIEPANGSSDSDDGLDSDFRIEEEPATDSLGHGTAILGVLNEYLPDAEIESLRVLGSDLRGSAYLVLAGLMWGVERGYDIINCSFSTTNQNYLAAFKKVIDQAFKKNVLVVSACHNLNYRRESYPAFFPSVLSTTSGKLDGLEISRQQGELVEFAARGEGLRVPWTKGSYRMVTGSSFAAPHLSVLAAKIRQLHPNWNAVQVKTELYAYAESVRH